MMCQPRATCATNRRKSRQGGLAAGTTPSSTLTIMKGLPVPVCMRPGQVERVQGFEPWTFSLGIYISPRFASGLLSWPNNTSAQC